MPSAIQMRKRTATVYVGDQQTTGLCMQRYAHIDDVAGLQINLGGRARAFDHKHVVLGSQCV